MITASEFIRRWKYSRLCHLPDEEEYDLPHEHLAFLKEAGLPARTHILIRFEAVEQGLPPLPGAGGTEHKYLLLGTPSEDELDTHFCLEVPTGTVFAFVPSHKDALEFVNTSVIAFAECLLLYVESFLCVPPEEVPEDVISKFDTSEKIRLQMGIIDPAVAESSDHFWPQQLYWNAMDMGGNYDTSPSDPLDW